MTTDHQQTPVVLPNGVQWTVEAERQRERRGHDFYPSPAVLATIPPLYATEETTAPEKILHLHYFVGGSDWYVTEIDPESGISFGWAEVTPGGGEWGYTSLPELEQINVHHGLVIVERDLDWTPTAASAVRGPDGNPRA
ncbi:DUF2958 domain-containing protein [Streptomyces sp. NPDC046925]|uniref:DUF2958 domain-containing protein n=1 Tax=Streptomyces sp. NPDC046925 TaxID=3155375 RepID=UPI0033F9E13C